MAGFMAGFGPAFAQSFNQTRQEDAQQKDDIFKLTFKTYLDGKDARSKAIKADQANVAAAKALAEQYNVPEGAWPKIYEWKTAGQSDEFIAKQLSAGKFLPKASEVRADTPLVPADPVAKTADNGAPVSTAPAPVMPKSGGLFSLRDKYAAAAKDKISTITGETPDAVNANLSGSYNPNLPASAYTFSPGDMQDYGKLTGADVAGKYHSLQMAVMNNPDDPKAKMALDRFEKVELPIDIKSLQATDAHGSKDLADAFQQKANASTPEEIKYAQKNINAQIAAIKAEEAIKSGNKNGFEFSAILAPDGSVITGRTMQTVDDNTGERIYVDDKGNKITGATRVIQMNDDAAKQYQDILTARQSDVQKHEDNLVNLGSGVGLFNKISGLVESTNGAVLTTVAGAASAANSLVHNASAVVQIANNMFKDAPNGVLTGQAFEDKLRKEQILPPGAHLSDLRATFEHILGDANIDLGVKHSILKAEVMLMGFRAGAMEGTSGQAMSNKDFDRLMTIINGNSSDPKVFMTALADYLYDRTQAVDGKAQLANKFNAKLEAFHTQYQFYPVDKIEPTFSDYLNANPKNADLSQGWTRLNFYRSKTAPFNPAVGADLMRQPAPQGQPQGQQQAAPSGLSATGLLTTDGRPLFRTPDGKLVTKSN